MPRAKQKKIVLFALIFSAFTLNSALLYAQQPADLNGLRRNLSRVESTLGEEGRRIDDYERQKHGYFLGSTIGTLSELFAGEREGVQQIRQDVRELRRLAQRTGLLINQNDLVGARASLNLLLARRSLLGRRIYNFFEGVQVNASRALAAVSTAGVVVSSAPLLTTPAAPAAGAVILHTGIGYAASLYSDSSAQTVDLLSEHDTNVAAASAAEGTVFPQNSPHGASAAASSGAPAIAQASQYNNDLETQWQAYRRQMRREDSILRQIAQMARTARVRVRPLNELAQAARRFRDEWRAQNRAPADVGLFLLEIDAARQDQPPLLSQYRIWQNAWQARILAARNVGASLSSRASDAERNTAMIAALLRPLQNRSLRRTNNGSIEVEQNFHECVQAQILRDDCKAKLIIAASNTLPLRSSNHESFSFVSPNSVVAGARAAIWNEQGVSREILNPGLTHSARGADGPDTQGLHSYHGALLAHEALNSLVARGAVLSPPLGPDDLLALELHPTPPSEIALRDVQSALPQEALSTAAEAIHVTADQLRSVRSRPIPNAGDIVPRESASGRPVLSRPHGAMDPDAVMRSIQDSAGYANIPAASHGDQSESSETSGANAGGGRTTAMDPDEVMADIQAMARVGEQLTLSRFGSALSFLARMPAGVQSQVMRLLSHVSSSQSEQIGRLLSSLSAESLSGILGLVERLPEAQVLSALQMLQRVPAAYQRQAIEQLSQVPTAHLANVFRAAQRISPQILAQALILAERRGAAQLETQRAGVDQNPSASEYSARAARNNAVHLPIEYPESFLGRAHYFGFFGFSTGVSNDSLVPALPSFSSTAPSYFRSHPQALAALMQDDVFALDRSASDMPMRMTRFMRAQLAAIEEEALGLNRNLLGQAPQVFLNDCQMSYRSALNASFFRSFWPYGLEDPTLVHLQGIMENLFTTMGIFSINSDPLSSDTHAAISQYQWATIGSCLRRSISGQTYIPNFNLMECFRNVQHPPTERAVARLIANACETSDNYARVVRGARSLVASHVELPAATALFLGPTTVAQGNSEQARFTSQLRAALGQADRAVRREALRDFLRNYVEALIGHAAAPHTEQDLIRALSFENPSMEMINHAAALFSSLANASPPSSICGNVPVIGDLALHELALFEIDADFCTGIFSPERLAQLQTARRRFAEIVRENPLAVLNLATRQPRFVAENLANINALASEIPRDDGSSPGQLALRLLTLPADAAASATADVSENGSSPEPSNDGDRFAQNIARAIVTAPVRLDSEPARINENATGGGHDSTSDPTPGAVNANPILMAPPTPTAPAGAASRMEAGNRPIAITETREPFDGARQTPSTALMAIVDIVADPHMLAIRRIPARPLEVAAPHVESSSTRQMSSPTLSTTAATSTYTEFEVLPGQPQNPNVARNQTTVTAAAVPTPSTSPLASVHPTPRQNNRHIPQTRARMTLPIDEFISLLFQLNALVPESNILRRRWTPELTRHLAQNSRRYMFPILANMQSLVQQHPGPISGPLHSGISEEFAYLLYQILSAGPSYEVPTTIPLSEVAGTGGVWAIRSFLPEMGASAHMSPSMSRSPYFENMQEFNSFMDTLNGRFSSQNPNGRRYLPHIAVPAPTGTGAP